MAKRLSMEAPRFSEGRLHSTLRGDSSAGNSAPAIDELEQTPSRPSPPGRNGPAGLPRDSDKGQEVRSGQTIWSDEDVEKLRALYPTHSASAIAKQLGRCFNAVRGKAEIWV
jgi:hypothetical protein